MILAPTLAKWLANIIDFLKQWIAGCRGCRHRAPALGLGGPDRAQAPPRHHLPRQQRPCSGWYDIQAIFKNYLYISAVLFLIAHTSVWTASAGLLQDENALEFVNTWYGNVLLSYKQIINIADCEKVVRNNFSKLRQEILPKRRQWLSGFGFGLWAAKYTLNQLPSIFSPSILTPSVAL